MGSSQAYGIAWPGGRLSTYLQDRPKAWVGSRGCICLNAYGAGSRGRWTVAVGKPPWGGRAADGRLADEQSHTPARRPIAVARPRLRLAPPEARSPLGGGAVDQRQLDEVQLHILAGVLDAVRRHAGGALQGDLDGACRAVAGVDVHVSAEVAFGWQGRPRAAQGWPMQHPPTPCACPPPRRLGPLARKQMLAPLTVGPHRHVDGDIHVAGALVLVPDAQPKVPLGLADGEGAWGWGGWGWVGREVGVGNPASFTYMPQSLPSSAGVKSLSRRLAEAGCSAAAPGPSRTTPRPHRSSASRLPRPAGRAAPPAPAPAQHRPNTRQPCSVGVCAGVCVCERQGLGGDLSRGLDCNFLEGTRRPARSTACWSGAIVISSALHSPKPPRADLPLACFQAAGRVRSVQHLPRRRRRPPTSRPLGLACGTASSAWAAPSGSRSCTWA